MHAGTSGHVHSSSLELSSGAFVHAAVSGVIAGVVMAMFAMMIALVSGYGFWAPPRAIAAAFLGPQLAGPGFALGSILLGMMIHMMLSAGFGVGFGVAVSVIAREAGMLTLLVLGMAAGVALWAGSTYVVAPALNGAELFTAAMPAWAWFAAHAMFGVALGALYSRMRHAA